MTPTHRAHPMAKSDPIVAAASSNWAAVHSEHHAVTFGERYHFDASLHPRSLFGQHKFATLEVFGGPGEEDRDLLRKNVLAV